MYSSRVRRRGFNPFVLRAQPPDKKQEWISQQEFKDNLSLELQRDYARVFRISDADSMDSDDLIKLFCEYNEQLPLLPVHLRRGPAIHRQPSYRKTLKRLLSMTDPDLDGPWNPKVSAIPERLIPTQDFVEGYEDSESPTRSQEPAWAPPSRIEHELVYPPRAPVVGRDENTGKDIVQPLSQDWLRVMLEEQEARYEALKLELQAAVSAAKDAVSEVTMTKAMLEAEEAKFKDFLDEIVRICGQETVDYIRELAAFGERYGFLERGATLQDENNDNGDTDDDDNDDNNDNDNADDDDVNSDDNLNEDSDEVDCRSELKAKQVNIAPSMRDHDSPAPLSAKTPEPEPEPEATNPPASEELASPVIVEANVPAEPPEVKSSPLAGFVYRLAERIFSKRRREEDDDEDNEEKASADDNVSETEQDIRPHKKRRCNSPSEPIAQPPPPTPLPPSPDPEGPRFFIDRATGSVTLNNAHPDNIKRGKQLKKDSPRSGLRRGAKVDMAVERRSGIPEGDIVQLRR
ncbi:hypothetical protein BJ912DRAFT_954491 [Pholiota molesta]|nr:hypothetical protein BJ912DRAFT_954491 [Pholiota molesta]